MTLVFSSRHELVRSEAQQLTNVFNENRIIEDYLDNIKETKSRVGFYGQAPVDISLEEQLFDCLAGFKQYTAKISMHLSHEWRASLFGQLDRLIDVEEWDEHDLPPKLGSFATFLRMLLIIRPDRRPGIGASSDGMIIAAWTVGINRLTIECLPKDKIRWVLTRATEAEGVEEIERAAGDNVVSRLIGILAPYDPQIWFNNA